MYSPEVHFNEPVCIFPQSPYVLTEQEPFPLLLGPPTSPCLEVMHSHSSEATKLLPSHHTVNLLDRLASLLCSATCLQLAHGHFGF